MLEHPPYSLDLAPYDFYLFLKMKNTLMGTHFQSVGKVKPLECSYFTSSLGLRTIVTMSDMETEPPDGQRQAPKTKRTKKKAADPPSEETDNNNCRHHKEIQKFVKMMNGRLSFLEHCIKSEKEFPDLTDDDALAGYQKDQDELSSRKEHKLSELALFLPCPVLDCPENTNNSINLNDPPETNAKKHSREASHDNQKIAIPNTDGGFNSPKFVKKKPKKGETIHNRNTIKEPKIYKPSKPVTPNLSFAAALSGAPNKNNIPGTSAASEEAPTINEKNNENCFGFNDASSELRRFFLNYPFLLEMGRQFRNAKDEEED
ncbi:hypothetical protein TNCV_866331 [Trichonephila clavipes]|nr:hypothetical protein TNCV_866331 [Trichonephila clavipes]